MNRQAVLIAVVVTAVLAVLLAIVWGRDGAIDEGPELTGEEPVEEIDEEPDLLPADLYFPGAGGRLYVEHQEVPTSDALDERISAVVEALLAGPRSASLRAPLPAGVHVRKVYLADGGTAFLDFESPEGAPPPPSGSRREILMVYSLVDTVVLNFESIDRLVLLWNGRQLRTFAGHLDTMRPLVANTDLIAAPLE